MLAQLKKLRKNITPSLRLCSAIDPEAEHHLMQLNSRLQDFYNGSVIERYYQSAEAANSVWHREMKAHWHLMNSIPYGAHVADLACGSAHPCRNLAALKIRYTGIDWCAAQMRRNQRVMQDHFFIVSSMYKTPLHSESFDVTTSFYAIEHTVWPHRLLDEMYRITRPGGLIAILCPPFRIRNTIKSFNYGLSAKSFQNKLKSGGLSDIILHLYQRLIAYPVYLKKHYRRGSNHSRFLINLDPVCLERGVWFPDADAVYLTDTAEIVTYLRNLGAQVVEEWPRHAYVLMRKNLG